MHSSGRCCGDARRDRADGRYEHDGCDTGLLQVLQMPDERAHLAHPGMVVCWNCKRSWSMLWTAVAECCGSIKQYSTSTEAAVKAWSIFCPSNADRGQVQVYARFLCVAAAKAVGSPDAQTVVWGGTREARQSKMQRTIDAVERKPGFCLTLATPAMITAGWRGSTFALYDGGWWSWEPVNNKHWPGDQAAKTASSKSRTSERPPHLISSLQQLIVLYSNTYAQPSISRTDHEDRPPSCLSKNALSTRSPSSTRR